MQHHAVVNLWCGAVGLYVHVCVRACVRARVPKFCTQEQDDALWSDEDSDGEGGTDFKTAKAILESALPELDDGEEWATDSEEEFE